MVISVLERCSEIGLRRALGAAARPGVVSGHGGAKAGRLRAELEELTVKPVLLNIGEPGPRGGPEDAGAGRGS